MLRGAVLAVLALVCVVTPASGAPGPVRTLRASVNDPPDSPGGQGLSHFADRVAALSGGQLVVKVYPSSQLGNDNQVRSLVQGGTIDFSLQGSPTLSGTVKEYAVLDLPFQFRSDEHAHRVLDGPAGEALLKRFADKGIHALGFWEIGFRQMTNSRRPIARPGDLSGLKMRVVASPVFIDWFGALGANPVPMAISEVYTALESKAIDGQDNPVGNIATLRFDEVQKHLSLTSHVYTSYTLIASSRTWDRLSPQERDWISRAADESKSWQRAQARRANDELLQRLSARMTVTTPDARARDEFRDSARPVRERVFRELDPAFARLWQDAVDHDDAAR